MNSQVYMGNIWDYHPQNYIVVPTNGDVNRSGEAVMGRGLALQTAKRFPEFPRKLGDSLRNNGNTLGFWTSERLVTFPVKHHWYEKADISLIESCVKRLIEVTTGMELMFYIPKVGCGNGQLEWEEVKPILELLPDNFFLVDLK